ncbi:MAG: type II secretion system F family protein [Actinobacteria bacterium]|nr:type II secretion system F family protein [Actinomycetota bacterium]
MTSFTSISLSIAVTVTLLSYALARILLRIRSRQNNRRFIASLAPAQPRRTDVLPLDADASFRFRLIESFQDSHYGKWFKSVAIRSGTWDENRVLTLIGRKGELALGLFILGIFLNQQYPGSALLFLFLLPAISFFLPDIFLYNRTIKRLAEIEQALPETIDLLSMCVNAGLGFQAGMLRVAQTKSNPLSDEFNRVLTEMRLGESRSSAFLRLADRLGIESLRQFVNAVLQVDRLGVPIAKVLDDQAESMRNLRRESAREQAQKIPVKILAPIMIFLLPALLIIVLGPAVITIIGAFA